MLRGDTNCGLHVDDISNFQKTTRNSAMFVPHDADAPMADESQPVNSIGAKLPFNFFCFHLKRLAFSTPWTLLDEPYET